jgi:pimeloyl-ACP methyl ester carboxylesterase
MRKRFQEWHMNVRPFAIHVDDARLDDLRGRLRSSRLPGSLDDDSWEDGAGLAFMRWLVDRWANGFDWRTQEARLNEMPHFMTEIDGTDVHFVHRRGQGPAPMPLILTHGWPGSFVEMEQIIPLLADPGAHGGDPADAFHVVVPSLPGFGFSGAPREPGFGPHHIAGLWRTLMSRLGYARFGAQGGDWGASVSTWLAHRFPADVVGIHLNFIPGSYRPPLGEGQAPLTAEEQDFIDRMRNWQDGEGAYGHVQGTKPQTLAYALADSPVGLAAWIAEKFRSWSDCDGDVERAIPLDDLLTNISLYWFGGSVEATLRLYKEGRRRPVSFGPGERVSPPLGVALFPKELPMPPRSWVDRCYTVVRWTPMPKGGHFAAMEQPTLLAEEIRSFFRPLRQ